MSVYILTETNFSGSLLSILLPTDRGEFEIRVSSAIYSSARTVLVKQRGPVAVVLDAHGTEEVMIDRRRQEAEEVIGLVAPRDSFRVFMVIPEMEVLLFRHSRGLRRLYGEKVTDHLIELASYNARQALAKLMEPGEDYESFRWSILTSLTPEEQADLANDELIRDLSEFIESASTKTLSTS